MLFRPLADFLRRISKPSHPTKRKVSRLSLVEHLEERVVLSFDAVQVKDINTQPVVLGSDPANFVSVNGIEYFTATTQTGGVGLWKTDGTSAGTVQVHPNIAYNNDASMNLVRVKDGLFFVGFGNQLWKSDGTEAGTVMVKNFYNPNFFGTIDSLTNVNGTLFFRATSALGSTVLWRSDGTAAGTYEITPNSSPLGFQVDFALTNVNGRLFFTASTANAGYELWTSDGTSFGTVMVKDIYPGTISSSPLKLTNVNGTLYFSVYQAPGTGWELWKSDGTEFGTVQVKDILPGAGGSAPLYLTNVNGTLYFTAYDGTTVGPGLWKSDGTSAGTVKLKDFANFQTSSLTGVDGTLFFVSTDATGDRELWKSDGTAAGTIRVKDINPGSSSSNPTLLTNVNGTLFFTASDSQGDRELWKSDGTSTGTVRVKDIKPGVYSANPTALSANNGVLYFSADDGVSGRELWKSDGTPAGTVRVKDIRGGTQGADAEYLVNVNGTLFFSADDAASGNELWKSDGTPNGTVRVKDILPGIDGSDPRYLTSANGVLYFSAEDKVAGRELWKSDGTAAGTVRVKDIDAGPDGSGPYNLVNVNGKVFFTADDGAYGTELWVTDGTEAGTVMVKDIYAGSGESLPRYLTNVNGILYFVAENAAYGRELWKSDGTAAGTVLVKDIVTGADSSELYYLTNVNGILYFVADEGAYGAELWKSDGTANGTVQVKDIHPGSDGSDPRYLTSVNGILYFIADDGAYGDELWKSDGTTAGTVMVRDIRPGSDGSDIEGSYLYAGGDPTYFFANQNGILYFAADDGVHGSELWKSDGTAAGTVMVKDITPGSESSDTHGLSIFLGAMYFFASRDGDGSQLWTTDGTNSGTVPVQVNLPGGDAFYPEELTMVNSTLFFLQDTEATGYELWKIASSNVAPTDISLSSTTIAENNAADATVGTLSATDPNLGDTFTFSLVPGTGSTDNASFSIAGNVLKIAPIANFETKNGYSIRIRVTDQGGLSYEESFSIAVTNVNESPTSLTLSPTSIAEGNAPNATVGALSVVDPDAGGSFTYSLVGGSGSTDNTSFTIVGNLLKIIPVANRATKDSYSVRIRVADQGGLGLEQSFPITVTAVNQAPTDITLSPTTIAENNLANATVGTLGAVDLNSGDTFTFSLVAGTGSTDNSSFTISGSTLKLDVSADFESKPSYAIRIRVADQDGLSFEEPFTITILNVNEAPVIDLNGSSSGTGYSGSFTTGGSAVAIVDIANLIVTDVDSSNLTGATATISNLLDGASEILNVTVPAGSPIQKSYVNGVLTLTGTDTLAHYQAVLRTLTYVNNAPTPNSTTRTVNVVVSDGALSSPTGISTVTVTAPKPSQVLTPSTTTITAQPSSTVSFDVNYTTLNANGTSAVLPANGITVSTFFNSSKLTFQSVTNALQADIFDDSAVVVNDTNDLDGDPLTDKYFNMIWNSGASTFPAGTHPAKLFTVTFTAAAGFSESTKVNLGGKAGANFRLVTSQVTVSTGSVFDIDGSGGALDGFTDGALVFGYLAGASDVKLAKCLSGNATRTVTQVRTYLDSLRLGTTLDIDGNGTLDGFTDGALVFGYLAGASDVKLAKCIAGNATRTVSQVRAYLDQLTGKTTVSSQTLIAAMSLPSLPDNSVAPANVSTSSPSTSDTERPANQPPHAKSLDASSISIAVNGSNLANLVGHKVLAQHRTISGKLHVNSNQGKKSHSHSLAVSGDPKSKQISNIRYQRFRRS